VKYKFRQNCTEAKFTEVLKAWNEWKPWQLSQEHALVDMECGYGHLWVQVRQPANVGSCQPMTTGSEAGARQDTTTHMIR